MKLDIKKKFGAIFISRNICIRYRIAANATPTGISLAFRLHLIKCHNLFPARDKAAIVATHVQPAISESLFSTLKYQYVIANF